ncbi:lipoprotein-releasing ABC transporter permease subunit [Rheinheimera sediminis]|uniref:lipoprotein-releasing ABC transporter permease subunit n=1 Tax=Rheinheimera sp. YQF-1 TaxID=2499626 RepID=UPI000FDCADCD|nr:lipoprotein-releasing ABC transporter permease subunit [Rheinheimera sp. YQF-1]RVT49047.1 lipoprotein-releasing ABC transporter permease subunit [Rheinheimera sp. YQF-1]
MKSLQFPLSVRIGLRYSQSRKGQGFLSFITLFSVTGIFLGVMALTIVSSVMNGFEAELKKRILGVVPHLIVQSSAEPELDISALQRQFQQIQQATPYLQLEALAQSPGQLTAVLLQGITPGQIPIFLQQALVSGDWSALTTQPYSVILGAGLADELKVGPGQQIRLLLAEGGSFTPMGWLPRQRLFTVAGLINTGSEVDNSVALVHLPDLKRLSSRLKEAPQWRISLAEPFAAPALAKDIIRFPAVEKVTDWRDSHGKLFAAVAMEKAMMWLMLLLIVAVAAFNIVSALVMMVTEKQREVAILKTQGMTDAQLFAVFAVQGMNNGLLGTLSGAMAGIVIAWQLNDILSLLGISVVAGVALPVDIQPVQIFFIVVSALVLTALAVVYPAWRAVQVQPAEILRDE